MSKNIQNNKITIGIIGYGKLGRLRHKILKMDKRAIVLKIFDPNEKGIEKKYYCNSAENVITDPRINTIFISTPNYLNAKYTCLSLKNKKNVFCEKPPAISIQEMKNVIKLEKYSKKKLMYGFNHRQHESIIAIKKMIDSNKFGKILWARGRYGKSVTKDFFNNWRSIKKYSGGGILIDQGIHMLDLLDYFCGSFDIIQSMKSASYWSGDIEDNVFINLKNTKKNILCSMHSTMTQWRHIFSLEIFLERGYLVLNGLKTSSNSYGKEVLTYALNRSLPPEASWTKQKNIIFKTDKSFNNEIDIFLTSILKNYEIKSGNSLDALNIVKIIEKIYKSKI